MRYKIKTLPGQNIKPWQYLGAVRAGGYLGDRMVYKFRRIVVFGKDDHASWRVTTGRNYSFNFKLYTLNIYEKFFSGKN